MQGRRLPDGWHSRDSQPGDYWKAPRGGKIEDVAAKCAGERGKDWQWEIRDPNGDIGSIGSHEVTEHEDGTITVSPSILNDRQGGWHGYLERGVWRGA